MLQTWLENQGRHAIHAVRFVEIGVDLVDTVVAGMKLLFMDAAGAKCKHMMFKV